MTTAAASRTCLTCPSMKKTDREVENHLGVTVDGPVCGLKLIPIGRPGVSEPNITKTIAGKCDSYGAAPAPGNFASAPVFLEVAMPDMAIRAEDPDSRVRSCVSCKSYVPPLATKKKTGWKAGFCRARGSLLLQDRLAQYARGCTYKAIEYSPLAAHDANSADGVNIFFLPEYEAGFGAIDPLAELRKLWDKNKIDPRAYPSDGGKISDDAAKWGVRGWRRIEDPAGFGPAVRLPLFNIDMLPEQDRAWVPLTGDDEAPDLYIDYTASVYALAVLWTKLDETPAIWGSAGNGKTELFRHMAWLMGAPFTRISITESSEIDDIAGKMMYSPEKGTYFHYGRIPQAWGKVNVCVLDEPNTGPPAVWQFIRPMTDNSKQLRMDQNQGEALVRHQCCFMGLAMNQAWDPRNVGAMNIADADGRRLAHIEMPAPPPEVERLILSQRLEKEGWDGDQAKETVELALKIAVDIRQNCADGNLPISWGVAQNIKVTKGMRYFPPMRAYELAIAASLEPHHQEIIATAVKSYTES